MIVRELELDLDAFEGPFDLLLALVLKEELDLADVDLAGIVVTFVASLAFFVWWQFVRKPKADVPKPRSRPIPKGPTMAVPRGRVR